MDHLPICDACGQPYEHHRPLGVSADGRRKKIACIMNKDGSVRAEQRMYVQALLQKQFQQQLGGNERTFVDKLEYEAVKKALADEQHNIVLLAEEHRVELEKERDERRILMQDVQKAEARIRELQALLDEKQKALRQVGGDMIAATRNLEPVKAENERLRKRNIELERLNATLEERIKHAKPNGVHGKLPFTAIEDSAPSTPSDKETT